MAGIGCLPRQRKWLVRCVLSQGWLRFVAVRTRDAERHTTAPTPKGTPARSMDFQLGARRASWLLSQPAGPRGRVPPACTSVLCLLGALAARRWLAPPASRPHHPPSRGSGGDECSPHLLRWHEGALLLRGRRRRRTPLPHRLKHFHLLFPLRRLLLVCGPPCANPPQLPELRRGETVLQINGAAMRE